MAADVVEISTEARERFQRMLGRAQDFDQLTQASISLRTRRIQLMHELADVEGFIEEVDDRLDAITAQRVTGR